MSDSGAEESGRKLTGRGVLMIALAFFGTVIGVNAFMAVKAVGTFPGLEAKNGFVESQTFQERRAAQEALGWRVAATLADGELAVAFTDAAGAPVEVARMDAIVGRPTSVDEDREPEFTYRAGTFRTPMTLPAGNWDVRLVARAPDGTEFRKRVEVRVE
ncbi:MAG: nitrogen fixation protein FixH [Deinococcus-Thermus bacterium]|jgi:nitrogen fixation protein FixH|nr:nitrogen fixation protein FixH [Deinococcota bacterium]